VLILRNEHLDLLPQLGILAAGLIKKRSTRFRGSLQRSVEKVLGPPPKFLPHGELPALSHQSLLDVIHFALNESGRRATRTSTVID
jgi:hypothetical protein